MNDALEALFSQIPDGPMKDALRAQDEAFAEECLLAYFDGDAATRADIVAFFDSGGPEMVENVKQELKRDEDGTPTARDLDAWLS